MNNARCAAGQGIERSGLARRQLYVALTRAQDELHLFASGQQRIVDELRKMGALEVAAEPSPLEAVLKGHPLGRLSTGPRSHPYNL